jgi:hypothetical protein
LDADRKAAGARVHHAGGISRVQLVSHVDQDECLFGIEALAFGIDVLRRLEPLLLAVRDRGRIERGAYLGAGDGHRPGAERIAIGRASYRTVAERIAVGRTSYRTVAERIAVGRTSYRRGHALRRAIPTRHRIADALPRVP